MIIKTKVIISTDWRGVPRGFETAYALDDCSSFEEAKQQAINFANVWQRVPPKSLELAESCCQERYESYNIAFEMEAL